MPKSIRWRSTAVHLIVVMVGFLATGIAIIWIVEQFYMAHLSAPLLQLNANINLVKAVLLFGLVLTLSVTVLVSLRFSQKVTGSLEKIGSLAGSIASGDFDCQVSFKDGDEFDLLAKTVNEMGHTLRGKVEQASREKSKLETVISAMTSGVILCDSEGCIDFINEAAAKIFSIEGRVVTGLPLQTALRNFLLNKNMQEILTGGGLKLFEISLFFPEPRILQVHMVPVEGGDGREVMGVLTVLHDITGLRSLESMRSEFVANVSHELRTPLTTIRGYAETLLDESIWENAEDVRTILTVIDKEAARLARLLNDLLNLSQIESSQAIMKKQKIVINKIIDDAVELLRARVSKKRITVGLDLPTEELTLRGNPDWLLQLFIGILDNAIKYTSSGGSIKIKLEQKSKEMLISISDTGIGISAKDLPYIFERFYRVDKARSRRLGGTGLGLAIAKHIVKAHDGRIEVRSIPSVGTTFYVYLPL